MGPFKDYRDIAGRLFRLLREKLMHTQVALKLLRRSIPFIEQLPSFCRGQQRQLREVLVRIVDDAFEQCLEMCEQAKHSRFVEQVCAVFAGAFQSVFSLFQQERQIDHQVHQRREFRLLRRQDQRLRRDRQLRLGRHRHHERRRSRRRRQKSGVRHRLCTRQRSRWA